MSVFLWDPGATGDFDTPTNWIAVAGGTPPPGSTDAAIFVGGTTTVGAGESVADAINIVVPILSSETFDISGTWTTGGFFTVGAAPITVESGGTLDITNILAASAPETVTIGGTLGLGGTGVGAGPNLTYAFDTGTGVIDFASSGALATQNITGVASGDEFVVGGKDFIGDTVSYSGTTLTVKNGAIPVFTMNHVTADPGTTFTIVDTNIIEAVPVCYARGTMIRTPDGELPIEKLRPGKQVIALVDGAEIPQTVTWLGHRRIDLGGHPRPETVAPIRIQRDAFADGMPHRDLVVSPDHAIFVDGKLICARQLVNGTTIRQELNWPAVDYYHVELDRHAILLAEGLPAESYIDTGNSGFFANSDAPLVLHPDLTDETDYPTRKAGSCAPFVWDEASVRPVWQSLADRAEAIGLPVPQRVTTTDAGLRLLTKRPSRRTIEPIYSDSNLVIFVLPSRSAEVQLLSRAQLPTAARPWLDDRRRLGVRVTRVVLRGADDLREIPVDHHDLTRGWWAVERDGQVMSRWTDGEAVLPLPAMRGTVMLEIHLASSMTYVVDAVPKDGTERRAAA